MRKDPDNTTSHPLFRDKSYESVRASITEELSLARRAVVGAAYNRISKVVSVDNMKLVITENNVNPESRFFEASKHIMNHETPIADTVAEGTIDNATSLEDARVAQARQAVDSANPRPMGDHDVPAAA